MAHGRVHTDKAFYTAQTCAFVCMCMCVHVCVCMCACAHVCLHCTHFGVLVYCNLKQSSWTCFTHIVRDILMYCICSYHYGTLTALPEIQDRKLITTLQCVGSHSKDRNYEYQVHVACYQSIRTVTTLYL